MAEAFDLIVIGSGPGGYVAAIRAAQLGMKVACVEKDPTLGGTCLNVGCIPSKALLESSERYDEAKNGLAVHGIEVGEVKLNLDKMLKRKTAIVKQLTGGVQLLFKKNKITRMEGLGRLSGPNKVEVVSERTAMTVTAKRILVATGSSPATLPGVELDYATIGTSTEALCYETVPERFVVIGAGVIGLELGSVWARLGSKVTVLEYMPKLLPTLDDDVTKIALKAFKRQGIDFHFGVKVTGAENSGDTAKVTYEDAQGGKHSMVGDKVLVAVGRKPNTDGLRADKAGLRLNKRGFIEVDDQFRTGVENVWAIGDVVPGPMLAHKAEEEGIAAAENMAGLHGHVNYDAIPNIIYTHPEIASLGKSSQQLTDAGIPFKTGSFPYMANGRAKALAQKEGMVKILAHAETDRILGVQIVGARAGDLIAELALAVEFSATAEDVGVSVHAHPTLAEVVKEAALAVGGRVIHM
jgi:dihydrolipoamide dehydrogenase